MGSERDLVVDCATGWNLSDEEQMKKVEQHIRYEATVLLIGSPMCRAFSTWIADAGRQTELGQSQEPRRAMRQTLQVLLQDVHAVFPLG